MTDITPDNEQNDAPVPLSNLVGGPANQPDSRSRALIYGIGIMVAAVFLLACLFATPFGDLGVQSDDNDQLSEEEVRQIVEEVVGTQIAQAPMGDGSGMNSAEVQGMIDSAVATGIATLIPTNTPIPPTPTLIPVGVAEEDDAFQGPADAPVVIVEFSDFQCGYCGRWYNETLSQILEAYPDEVKFVYRDFPIFGEPSLNAAMATECAEEQGKFWEMHNRFFDRLTSNEDAPLDNDTFITYAGELGMDTEAFEECLVSERYADEVLADYQAATSYGLRGTPGFVVNGVVQSIGAQPFEVFSALIEAELAKLES